MVGICPAPVPVLSVTPVQSEERGGSCRPPAIPPKSPLMGTYVMCNICGGRSCLGSLLTTCEASLTLSPPGSNFSFPFFVGYWYGSCFSGGSRGGGLQRLLLLTIVSSAPGESAVVRTVASALGLLGASSGSFRPGSAQDYNLIL